MSPRYVDPADALRQGILACRKEQWRKGLDILSRLAFQEEGQREMPPLFYSYLGLAILRVEGRRHDGMELCRYALRLDPTEPDGYANLGYAYFILGRRKAAYRCLEQGLSLDDRLQRLHDLHEMLGVRGRPVLGWLGRSHPLNAVLGQAIARFRAWRRHRAELRELARL